MLRGEQSRCSHICWDNWRAFFFFGEQSETSPSLKKRNAGREKIELKIENTTKKQKVLVGARSVRPRQRFHIVTPPPARRQDELDSTHQNGGATRSIGSIQPSLRTLRSLGPSLRSLSSAPFALEIALFSRSRKRCSTH